MPGTTRPIARRGRITEDVGKAAAVAGDVGKADNYALSEATQQWTQMGVTKPQLSPIIDTYNNLQQTTNAANQYLQNPKMPHNREIAESFSSSEQRAQTKLNAVSQVRVGEVCHLVGLVGPFLCR